MRERKGCLLGLAIGAVFLLCGIRLDLSALRRAAEAATKAPAPGAQQVLPPGGSLGATPLGEALEADPVRLLHRIRALEQRLSQAEKRLADYDTRFLNHTHEFTRSTYDFAFIPFREFLDHPDRIHPDMKVTLIRAVTKPQATKTSPP